MTSRSTKLPMSHDDSWIGARLSPIAFDDEDDDNAVVAPYRQALSDSVLNERSALLGNTKPMDRSKIHPLWDEEVPLLQQSLYREERAAGNYHWGTLVCSISGIHLLAMGIHDLYLWYISFRQGYDVDVESWSLPFIAPSRIVLRRFGAFVPYSVFAYKQWWRMATAVFISTSVVEWILIFWSWKTLRDGGARPTRVWCFLYFLCAFTGYLWMMAFDLSGVGGAASWGTSGILCAAGGAKPRQRFILFLLAIAMIILALFAPTNSVMGTIGSSFFGWCFFGLGWQRVVSKFDKGVAKPKGLVRLLSGLALLMLWILPVLFTAFRVPLDELILSRSDRKV